MKAGALAPPIPVMPVGSVVPLGATAQRRPGRRPRRSSTSCACSTAPRMPLNEGRGVGPGDPTTPPPLRRWASTLNEGRGRRPRRSTCSMLPMMSAHIAQRRPGRRPRRSRPVRLGLADLLGRSTKAGASAPAIHSHTASRTAWPITLNEGRGVGPGDPTGRPVIASRAGPGAQRRPGRRPRRSVRELLAVERVVDAQRRPGRRPRRSPIELGLNAVRGRIGVRTWAMRVGAVRGRLFR